jgi:hypothetical protein
LVERAGRYHKIGYSAKPVDRLLTGLFVESHTRAPEQIVLDLDATDIPLYGHQPERFFHGYYDSYCYLPLHLFAGDQLLSARLRPANQDALAGSLEGVRRIVTQLRQCWPEVKIVLRADSGFCREELMGWCEAHHVDYTLMEALRLLALQGTEWAQAQVDTIRLKLLKRTCWGRMKDRSRQVSRWFVSTRSRWCRMKIPAKCLTRLLIYAVIALVGWKSIKRGHSKRC